MIDVDALSAANTTSARASSRERYKYTGKEVPHDLLHVLLTIRFQERL
jgi:hypothetical protein